jgi:hypothetical protein
MTTAKQGAEPTIPLSMKTKPTSKRRAFGLLGPLLATCAALLSAACGGGDGSSSDLGSGAGGSGAGTGGSVTLSVGAVGSPDVIGSVGPNAGRYFLTVQVTLRDVSAPMAVPAGYAYYTLTTAKGLEIWPADVSVDIAMPCSADTAVSVAAAFSCTLAFAVPTGDSPTVITYDDLRGDTATAPVVNNVPPPPDSVACDTFATYQNTGSNACTICLGTYCQDPYVELSDEQSDGTTCPDVGNACATCPLFPSSPGYCSCQDGCLGGCQPAFDAMFQCYVEQCAADCK